ncbi:MAG: G1 family glutamic endopeptidase [Streptosporangiaceae bacterium]
MRVPSKILAVGAALFVIVGLASSTARPTADASSAAASTAISQHAHPGFPQSANDPTDWYGNVDIACPTCHIRYVNANFTVPTLDCSNSNMGSGGAWMSLWAGLDGDGDSTLEQVGVQARCTSFANSSAQYFSFYERVPDGYVPLPVPVSPGNSISVSVYYDQSNNQYQFGFQNNTTSTGTSVEVTCPSGSTCENKTAEVIAEVVDPGPPEYDMPDFGSVSFSGTTVTSYDGTKGDLCKGSLWSSATVVGVDYEGHSLATVGSPSPCTGPDGFTVKYWQSQ